MIEHQDTCLDMIGRVQQRSSVQFVFDKYIFNNQINIINLIVGFLTRK